MSSDPVYELPAAFYFMVTFKGIPDTGIWEVPFQEVSGIKSSMDIEEVKEGGENRFIHKLPTRIKHGNLVLKTAVQKTNSPLMEWCSDILEWASFNFIETRDVFVKLLNKEGQALMQWEFWQAYPVSWEIGTFDAMKNEVAIETIELCYNWSIRSSC